MLEPSLIFQAGKFGIVPTVVNLGAALTFLSLVSWSLQLKYCFQENIMRRRVFFLQVPVVADWVMLTCMGKRDLYKKHKITHLNEVADTETVSDKLVFSLEIIRANIQHFPIFKPHIF